MTRKAEPLHFNALGTAWWLEDLAGASLLPLKHEIIQEVESFEARYSRFRPDSLISTLNTTHLLKRPPKEMLAMLRFASEMYEVSEGAFNITVGGELVNRGYGKGSAGQIRSPLTALSISDEQIRISDDTSIDFGGFGKGWLIDALGALLERRGVSQYLINGGGDILVNSEQPITIPLEHPMKPGFAIGEIRLNQGAVAGSSAQLRRWEHNGETQHHIIDPSRKSPSDKAAGTFVRAGTALLADTLATVVLIRPDLASKLERRFPATNIMVID